jgi:two-component system chemotaxis sensor kinase CheA
VKSNEKTIEEKGREDKSYQNHTEEKQSELIYVRVKMSKLDELQNIVAELIITKSAFSEYFKTKDQTMLEDTTQKISRIISSLQDEVSNMRMVPLEEVFSRFPRFVRDSSKELNKKINFVIEGAQIEIDRALISGIYDPILHILKNSMDHGIESPERREKLGKNPAGLIKLTARREKNNVFIEIFDDGKGIDIEKIRTMIIEKGIFSKEIVGQMKEKDLINYIKKGGFSTADSITRFSGRGVGVDAVDKIVKKLGGKLIIESKFEHWTKVTIQLPLTLSIIKAMIVTCEERLFAIPLNNIQETVDVIANNIETIHNQEIVVLREEVYPLLRLHNIIGSEIKDKNDILQGIVIGDNISKDILIVNSYESQTEIVVKNLPPLFDNVNLFSGISILGTGNMALILDINNLI